jgi:hypothetical protein
MGTLKGCLKGLGLAALLFVAAGQAAKADTLTPNSFTANSATFTGVAVTAFDNGFPNSSTNPLTTTDSVTFFANGGSGLSVQITCTSGCISTGNSASLYGAQIFTGPTSAPVLGPTTTFNFANALDSICDGGACNTTADPIDIVTITLASPDHFLITSASITMNFDLTGAPVTTPEPSSLLMLGSGVLGLFGFGLRRKAL